MSVVTALLALVNVGITAYLMFLNTHDMALLAGLLGFSIGVSVFVAFAFADPTARSIRRLADAAKSMSAGRLDTRVEVVSSSDEVGQLSGAFNAMAERLQSSFARERELEQARKEFISAVSHDLRTPLASIRAMVESRADGVVSDPETVSCYMRTSLAEVLDLGQLVYDLFELSWMDAGELELHLEEASLQDLVSDTLESMSAQAGGPETQPAGYRERRAEARGDGYTEGAAGDVQPGAELHPPHAARRHDPDSCRGRR